MKENSIKRSTITPDRNYSLDNAELKRRRGDPDESMLRGDDYNYSMQTQFINFPKTTYDTTASTEKRIYKKNKSVVIRTPSEENALYSQTRSKLSTPTRDYQTTNRYGAFTENKNLINSNISSDTQTNYPFETPLRYKNTRPVANENRGNLTRITVTNTDINNPAQPYVQITTINNQHARKRVHSRSRSPNDSYTLRTIRGDLIDDINEGLSEQPLNLPNDKFYVEQEHVRLNGEIQYMNMESARLRNIKKIILPYRRSPSVYFLYDKRKSDLRKYYTELLPLKFFTTDDIIDIYMPKQLELLKRKIRSSLKYFIPNVKQAIMERNAPRKRYKNGINSVERVSRPARYYYTPIDIRNDASYMGINSNKNENFRAQQEELLRDRITYMNTLNNKMRSSVSGVVKASQNLARTSEIRARLGRSYSLREVYAARRIDIRKSNLVNQNNKNEFNLDTSFTSEDIDSVYMPWMMENYGRKLAIEAIRRRTNMQTINPQTQLRQQKKLQTQQQQQQKQKGSTLTKRNRSPYVSQYYMQDTFAKIKRNDLWLIDKDIRKLTYKSLNSKTDDNTNKDIEDSDLSITDSEGSSDDQRPIVPEKIKKPDISLRNKIMKTINRSLLTSEVSGIDLKLLKLDDFCRRTLKKIEKNALERELELGLIRSFSCSHLNELRKEDIKYQNMRNYSTSYSTDDVDDIYMPKNLETLKLKYAIGKERKYYEQGSSGFSFNTPKSARGRSPINESMNQAITRIQTKSIKSPQIINGNQMNPMAALSPNGTQRTINIFKEIIQEKISEIDRQIAKQIYTKEQTDSDSNISEEEQSDNSLSDENNMNDIDMKLFEEKIIQERKHPTKPLSPKAKLVSTVNRSLLYNPSELVSDFYISNMNSAMRRSVQCVELIADNLRKKHQSKKYVKRSLSVDHLYDVRREHIRYTNATSDLKNTVSFTTDDIQDIYMPWVIDNYKRKIAIELERRRRYIETLLANGEKPDQAISSIFIDNSNSTRALKQSVTPIFMDKFDLWLFKQAKFSTVTNKFKPHLPVSSFQPSINAPDNIQETKITTVNASGVTDKSVYDNNQPQLKRTNITYEEINALDNSKSLSIGQPPKFQDAYVPPKSSFTINENKTIKTEDKSEFKNIQNIEQKTKKDQNFEEKIDIRNDKSDRISLNSATELHESTLYQFARPISPKTETVKHVIQSDFVQNYLNNVKVMQEDVLVAQKNEKKESIEQKTDLKNTQNIIETKKSEHAKPLQPLIREISTSSEITKTIDDIVKENTVSTSKQLEEDDFHSPKDNLNVVEDMLYGRKEPIKREHLKGEIVSGKTDEYKISTEIPKIVEAQKDKVFIRLPNKENLTYKVEENQMIKPNISNLHYQTFFTENIENSNKFDAQKINNESASMSIYKDEATNEAKPTKIITLESEKEQQKVNVIRNQFVPKIPEKRHLQEIIPDLASEQIDTLLNEQISKSTTEYLIEKDDLINIMNGQNVRIFNLGKQQQQNEMEFAPTYEVQTNTIEEANIFIEDLTLLQILKEKYMRQCCPEQNQINLLSVNELNVPQAVEPKFTVDSTEVTNKAKQDITLIKNHAKEGNLNLENTSNDFESDQISHENAKSLEQTHKFEYVTIEKPVNLEKHIEQIDTQKIEKRMENQKSNNIIYKTSEDRFIREQDLAHDIPPSQYETSNSSFKIQESNLNLISSATKSKQINVPKETVPEEKSAREFLQQEQVYDKAKETITENEQNYKINMQTYTITKFPNENVIKLEQELQNVPELSNNTDKLNVSSVEEIMEKARIQSNQAKKRSLGSQSVETGIEKAEEFLLEQMSNVANLKSTQVDQINNVNITYPSVRNTENIIYDENFEEELKKLSAMTFNRETGSIKSYEEPKLEIANQSYTKSQQHVPAEIKETRKTIQKSPDWNVREPIIKEIIFEESFLVQNNENIKETLNSSFEYAPGHKTIITESKKPISESVKELITEETYTKKIERINQLNRVNESVEEQKLKILQNANIQDFTEEQVEIFLPKEDLIDVIRSTVVSKPSIITERKTDEIDVSIKLPVKSTSTQSKTTRIVEKTQNQVNSSKKLNIYSQEESQDVYHLPASMEIEKQNIQMIKEIKTTPNLANSLIRVDTINSVFAPEERINASSQNETARNIRNIEVKTPLKVQDTSVELKKFEIRNNAIQTETEHTFNQYTENINVTKTENIKDQSTPNLANSFVRIDTINSVYAPQESLKVEQVQTTRDLKTLETGVSYATQKPIKIEDTSVEIKQHVIRNKPIKTEIKNEECVDFLVERIQNLSNLRSNNEEIAQEKISIRKNPDVFKVPLTSKISLEQAESLESSEQETHNVSLLFEKTLEQIKHLGKPLPMNLSKGSYEEILDEKIEAINTFNSEDLLAKAAKRTNFILNKALIQHSCEHAEMPILMMHEKPQAESLKVSEEILLKQTHVVDTKQPRILNIPLHNNLKQKEDQTNNFEIEIGNQSADMSNEKNPLSTLKIHEFVLRLSCPIQSYEDDIDIEKSQELQHDQQLSIKQSIENYSEPANLAKLIHVKHFNAPITNISDNHETLDILKTTITGIKTAKESNVHENIINTAITKNERIYKKPIIKTIENNNEENVTYFEIGEVEQNAKTSMQTDENNAFKESNKLSTRTEQQVKSNFNKESVEQLMPVNIEKIQSQRANYITETSSVSNLNQSADYGITSVIICDAPEVVRRVDDDEFKKTIRLQNNRYQSIKNENKAIDMQRSINDEWEEVIGYKALYDTQERANSNYEGTDYGKNFNQFNDSVKIVNSVVVPRSTTSDDEKSISSDEVTIERWTEDTKLYKTQLYKNNQLIGEAYQYKLPENTRIDKELEVIQTPSKQRDSNDYINETFTIDIPYYKTTTTRNDRDEYQTSNLSNTKSLTERTNVLRRAQEIDAKIEAQMKLSIAAENNNLGYQKMNTKK